MKVYAPTISQLIERLKELRREHGDVQVFLDDPDTGWVLPIGCMMSPDRSSVAITAHYYDKPEGAFSPIGEVPND